MEVIPLTIKAHRLAVNKSQRQLGEEVGVEQNTVSQWESGTRKPPSDKLPALARALDCTIDELFADETNAASES